MKRADFEAMADRMAMAAWCNVNLHLLIDREIDRAVRKAREEERKRLGRMPLANLLEVLNHSCRQQP